MTITILCGDSKSFLHKPINAGIKLVDHVDFSHYAYCIDGMVYEAVAPRSRKIPFSQWREKYTIVRTYDIEVPFSHMGNFMSTIDMQLDVPYAYSQIFAILIANVFHLKNKVDFNGKKAMICSEFVARPLAEVLGYQFSVAPDHIGMDELEIVLKNKKPIK
jgi:hypothetical protein